MPALHRRASTIPIMAAITASGFWADGRLDPGQSARHVFRTHEQQAADMTDLTRRTALQSGVALAALAACGPRATDAMANPGAADAAFAEASQRWLKETARLTPSFATYLGDHEFDGDLNDMSAAGRGARAALRADTRAAIDAIDRTQLNRENQVDAVMLADNLAAGDLDQDRIESWAWDPLTYSDLIGGSLYGLMARDFAPLPQRLLSAAARMEKLPALIEQARAALVPDRVPLVHAETWARQNPGTLSLIDDLILPKAGELQEADRARLLAAAETAKSAVRDLQTWIATDLTPRAKGDFRLGADLYGAKLRYAVDSPTPRAELRARAEADLARVRAEMFDIARTVLSSSGRAPRLSETPTDKERQTTIAAALDIAASDRAPRADVMKEVQASLDRATAFVREKDLITLPDAPVRVIEMPKFQQGVSVAYCDSPGPLDGHLDTFYAVSPIPQEWTDAQTVSFLREYNRRSTEELTVHEAMPGHYVQIWHGNQHPSVTRAVLGSGSFIEGWACYAQDVMIAAGHGSTTGEAEPLRRLVNLKWALRVISNAILDQGVHVDGWDETQAMDFMTGQAFQEEREAAGKWVRARVSSAQLSTYYVGWQAHLDLRREVETLRKDGFRLKAYHDELLAHGAPPVRLARALLLGEAIA
jgi:uncharacterized protein (DUF885 family)